MTGHTIKKWIRVSGWQFNRIKFIAQKITQVCAQGGQDQVNVSQVPLQGICARVGTQKVAKLFKTY